MMLYALKSAITLALLYSCFFALLSRETFHRFNRFVLLSILVASLVVPLIHVTTKKPTMVNMLETMVINPQSSTQEEASELGLATRAMVGCGDEASFVMQGWMVVFHYIYIIGVAVVMLITLSRVVALVATMRGGLRHTDEHGNTVILKPGNVAPFSVWRFIVMSVADYEAHRHQILAHEQEHIRQRHTLDLLFFEVVKTLQWFNPFVYFLGHDLEAIHEYAADEAVINKGIDAKTYQQLLVIKVMGNRLQPFANNLNHSTLKKRISMMHKKKSHGGMMLKALFAIPAIALAIYAFATPRPMESAVTTTEANTKPESAMANDSAAHSNKKAHDIKEAFEQYDGGEMALMKFLCDNMKYPKSAELAKKEGVVVLSFTVNVDGTVSDINVDKSVCKELDDEAIRVIKLTNGNWNPGYENGKPVNVKYTLPFTYRLK